MFFHWRLAPADDYAQGRTYELVGESRSKRIVAWRKVCP
jgi:hypothetical protein